MCALEFLSELTLSWALPFNCPIKLSNYSQAWYYIFSHNTIILGLINLILNNKPILLLYTHYLQYSDQDARTAGLSNHVTIKCILKTFCRVPSQQQTYINWQHQIWEGSVGPVCHESRHELRVSCKKRKQPIAQNYFSNKIYRGGLHNSWPTFVSSCFSRKWDYLSRVCRGRAAHGQQREDQRIFSSIKRAPQHVTRSSDDVLPLYIRGSVKKNRKCSSDEKWTHCTPLSAAWIIHISNNFPEGYKH